MTQTSPLIHQQHLLKLEPLCRSIAEALMDAGWTQERVHDAFLTSVSAECISCGISVSGEELYALAQPPSADHAHVKIGRLRMGDCARERCDSYYYRITFKAFPGADWARLVSQFEKGEPQRKQAGVAGNQRKRLMKYVRNLRAPAHVWITVAALVLVLVVRQWYVGGRIPLLREPEHFKVDTAAEEQGQQ
jgi:cytochrome P450